MNTTKMIVKCWDIGENKESCELDIMEYGNKLLEQGEIFKCIEWIQSRLSIMYRDPSVNNGIPVSFNIAFKHDLLSQLSEIVAINRNRDRIMRNDVVRFSAEEVA